MRYIDVPRSSCPASPWPLQQFRRTQSQRSQRIAGREPATTQVQRRRACRATRRRCSQHHCALSSHFLAHLCEMNGAAVHAHFELQSQRSHRSTRMSLGWTVGRRLARTNHEQFPCRPIVLHFQRTKKIEDKIDTPMHAHVHLPSVTRTDTLACNQSLPHNATRVHPPHVFAYVYMHIYIYIYIPKTQAETSHTHTHSLTLPRRRHARTGCSLSFFFCSLEDAACVESTRVIFIISFGIVHDHAAFTAIVAHFFRAGKSDDDDNDDATTLSDNTPATIINISPSESEHFVAGF